MTRFVVATSSEITIILIYFGSGSAAAAALLFLSQIAKMIIDRNRKNLSKSTDKN